MTSSKIILILVLIVAAATLFWSFFQRSEEQPSGEISEPEEETLLEERSNMKIESPAFQNNSNIPVKYTCDGEDVSPPLKITETPKGAQSLVLIVDDPDAPGGVWVHWTVWNIAPNTTEIAEDSLPEGAVEGVTDFGQPGWGGPCPPSGTHRYFFKVYALDTSLDLEPSARAQDIAEAMRGHILGQAQLIGLYQRR